ncbi:hypothetical protein NBRC111894_4462 [Sporolactobacillus inulinus]|uniref:Uncharacterized protein n=1 Tax=Sporolactobacillus inulinus TaxID=2078 RepID=A0A4Y1ZK70_9BACL|nr:hypothetical protein NBRC111894_4462 [Sporolactobacillus inulinus]
MKFIDPLLKMCKKRTLQALDNFISFYVKVKNQKCLLQGACEK